MCPVYFFYDDSVVLEEEGISEEIAYCYALLIDSMISVLLI